MTTSQAQAFHMGHLIDKGLMFEASVVAALPAEVYRETDRLLGIAYLIGAATASRPHDGDVPCR